LTSENPGVLDRNESGICRGQNRVLVGDTCLCNASSLSREQPDSQTAALPLSNTDVSEGKFTISVSAVKWRLGELSDPDCIVLPLRNF